MHSVWYLCEWSYYVLRYMYTPFFIRIYNFAVEAEKEEDALNFCMFRV